MNVGIKVQPSFANRQEVFMSDSVDVTSDHAFSLMSYNVLADCHTHPSTYPYRNPDQLHINSRHKGLMEELRYSNCDVICLQEVGPGYYKDTLEPEMKKLVSIFFFKLEIKTNEQKNSFLYINGLFQSWETFFYNIS